MRRLFDLLDFKQAIDQAFYSRPYHVMRVNRLVVNSFVLACLMGDVKWCEI